MVSSIFIITIHDCQVVNNGSGSMDEFDCDYLLPPAAAYNQQQAGLAVALNQQQGVLAALDVGLSGAGRAWLPHVSDCETPSRHVCICGMASFAFDADLEPLGRWT